MGQLASLPLSHMEARLTQGGLALRLFMLSRGIDGEEVEARMLPKSMSCGKTFRCLHINCRRMVIDWWGLLYSLRHNRRLS